MIGPAGTSLSTPEFIGCARWIQVDYYIEYEPHLRKYYNIHIIFFYLYNSV